MSRVKGLQFSVLLLLVAKRTFWLSLEGFVVRQTSMLDHMTLATTSSDVKTNASAGNRKDDGVGFEVDIYPSASTSNSKGNLTMGLSAKREGGTGDPRTPYKGTTAEETETDPSDNAGRTHIAGSKHGDDQGPATDASTTMEHTTKGHQDNLQMNETWIYRKDDSLKEADHRKGSIPTRDNVSFEPDTAGPGPSQATKQATDVEPGLPIAKGPSLKAGTPITAIKHNNTFLKNSNNSTMKAQSLSRDPAELLWKGQHQLPSEGINPSPSPLAPARFAYVFFLGGVTSTNAHHLGHIYNILVSVQILKDSGSTADMILLVHTARPNTTLPKLQQSMMQSLGVQIRYTPDSSVTGLDSTIYFESLPFEKLRVLDWTEYHRVMVMEADFMPHCNLDYLFHKSVDGTLQPNVFISIGGAPASPSMFVINPTAEHSFHRFLDMVGNYPHKPRRKRDKYSKEWQYPRDKWVSLYHQVLGPSGWQTKAWDFPGHDSPVGMLYSWIRYEVRNFSLIVGSHVYSMKKGSDQLLGPLDSPLCQHTCQAKVGSLTKQEYQTKVRMATSTKYRSPDMGPYWDFAQWQHDSAKPWELSKPSKTFGAARRWFQALKQMDEEHRWGLGLAVGTKWAPLPAASKPVLIPSRGLKIPLMEEWAQKQLKNKIVTSAVPTLSTLAANSLPQPTHFRQVPQQETKRAFVCVTGQLERLELTNKFSRLFKPILQRGYQLDVALVLTGGKGTYTNEDKSFNTKSHTPFYSNYTNAVNALTQHGVHVLTKDVYEQVENPPFHHQYYDLLRREQPGFRTDEAQMARALNHARIFQSYGHCLVQAQKASGSRTYNDKSLESYYNVFLRIRDDVGFKQALPEHVLTKLVEPPPGSVQVPGCRSWYGMNDRFASVAPDVVRTYFTRLYASYLRQHFPENRVFGPETYLMSTFVEAGLRILVNQDLKGVYKIVKTEEGQPDFAPDDLKRRFCPKEDKYHQHLLELYGWDF